MHVSDVLLAATVAITITLSYIGLFHVLDAFAGVLNRVAMRRRARRIAAQFFAKEPAALARTRRVGAE